MHQPPPWADTTDPRHLFLVQNILNRVNVPEIPIPTEDLSIGGAIAIVAAILVTLLGAILGGKAGTHFHRKVDRVA